LALTGDDGAALAAVHAARVTARAGAWSLAGEHAPDHGIDAATPLVIDVDATLVTAHSEKEFAAPTFKRGFGFYPLWAFLDHRADGLGEPLSVLTQCGSTYTGCRCSNGVAGRTSAVASLSLPTGADVDLVAARSPAQRLPCTGLALLRHRAHRLPLDRSGISATRRTARLRSSRRHRSKSRGAIHRMSYDPLMLRW
jgi:hypothetical protein